MRERAIDAARRATHLSHETRLLTSLAADAVDDGVHAAKRTIKSAQHRVEDLKDEATYRVKRQPFKALGIAVGVGLVLGMAVGWIGSRCGKAKST
jgi:ElaB/YqjD/DUF883 family membrane-anchored ribosome-binding protein